GPEGSLHCPRPRRSAPARGIQVLTCTSIHLYMSHAGSPRWPAADTQEEENVARNSGLGCGAGVSPGVDRPPARSRGQLFGRHDLERRDAGGIRKRRGRAPSLRHVPPIRDLARRRALQDLRQPHHEDPSDRRYRRHTRGHGRARRGEMRVRVSGGDRGGWPTARRARGLGVLRSLWGIASVWFGVALASALPGFTADHRRWVGPLVPLPLAGFVVAFALSAP